MKLRAFLMRLIELRWTAAFLLFVISLALPGLHLADGHREYGWVQLVFGWWVGVLIFEPAWFANPLFMIGMVYLRNGSERTAGILGLAALAFGGLSYRADNWIGGATEDVFVNRITALGAGFYVWMAAFLVLASCVMPTPSPALRRGKDTTDT